MFLLTLGSVTKKSHIIQKQPIMTNNRIVRSETIAQMIRAIDSEWDLREAELMEKGFTSVYRVIVETPSRRECVLKASPDGERHGIDTEARILTILAEHTSIPVPTVIGVNDAHDDLPTPFILMDSMFGTGLSFQEVGKVSDTSLQRIARQTGTYLAELHEIATLDSFGFVDRERSELLRGSRPSADVAQLTVASARESWPDQVRDWVDTELDTNATTRFGDLTPCLRSAFDEGIETLSGSFTPVLGRIDHGIHNLLLNQGEISSMLDWGFTLAVTRGYDLECVEYVLSGAVLSAIPGIPDRRELVQEAMLDGSQSTTAPPEEFHEYHSLYELLSCVRSMNHLDAGIAKVPDGHTETVADDLREKTRALLREFQ